jgi:branched-chain amino acid transport system ATP-binding protein
MTLLRVTDAVAGYSGSRVLHGFSLEIGAGECVAVLGPNGHGKTTLLRVISGLVRLSSGSVELDGHRLDRLSPDVVVRRGVTHIPQGDLPFPQMTVTDNLLMGGYLIKDRRERRERLDHIFTLFPRLQERRSNLARTLSGGERRMLALGRGLMGHPKVMLIDEPSLGLAPKVAAEVYDRIETIHASGISILLVDESAEHAAQLAERIYVVESGQVVRSGPAAEIVRDPELMAAYVGS